MSRVTLKSVPIRDLIEPVLSWNPNRDTKSPTISYIDLSSVDNVLKCITDTRKINAGDAPSRARQIVHSDDVIVSTVRPNLNGVAKIPPTLNGATASTGFCVLRSNPKQLESAFLFHWVKSHHFVSEMVRKATGASYPAVSDRIIFNSLLPLPPLPEQKRIAAILDQADELRRKRQRAIDRLNQLGQAIFYEMFGDLEVNNLGWETVSIRDACCEIVDCVNRTAPLSATETQFKMIRTTNVRNGRVDLTNVRFVSEETFLKWNRRLKPQSGDVLLTREAPVGGCGLIEGDDEIFLGQRLMLYRVEESKLTPEFLTYCFRSTYLEKQFDTASSGSTVKHLPLPACRAFQLRLPPIGLQKDFSARFKRLDAIRIQIEMQSIRIADLFQSLQHRAFTGTL